MTNLYPNFLHKSPLKIHSLANALKWLPSFFLVGASTGFGAVYAWQSGMQNGIALACLGVLMAGGLELAKPSAFKAAVTAGSPPQTRLALGLMALLAVAYSLSAEVSLVATNRQQANSGRAQIATQHDTAQSDLDTARNALANLGPVKPVAEAERAVASDKLDPAFARTSACADATLVASKTFCNRYFIDNSELVNSQAAQEFAVKIEKAEAALVSSAGIVDSDPGASAVSVYLAALGLHVDAETVAKLLVLFAVLALEVGSLTAGLLVTAGSELVPATLQASPTLQNSTVATPDATRPLAPNELAENPDNQPGQEQDTTGHSIRERLVAKLRVAGGSLAQSTRELAFELGCSKSALGEVLAKLETAGAIVRVAASHGKGSAIRLVEMTAAAAVAS